MHVRRRPHTAHPHGDLIYLDAGDTSLLPSLLKRGYWEPAITRALLRLVRPGDQVIEIGANVGYYTLLFAGLVGHRGSVIAFEADPRTSGLLRRSVAANERLPIVRVVAKAVSDRPGRATLHKLGRQQASSSLYAFAPEELAYWDDKTTPLEVDATTLDTFLGPDGPVPQLVKIDAEGAEPAILAGMSALLARAPHLQMIIEYLPEGLARAGHEPRAFLTSLAALGFRLHTIERGGRLRASSVDQVLARGHVDLYLRRTGAA